LGCPSIVNRLAFAFEPLFLADEEMRPLLVPVVKATYAIGPRGKLALAEKQVPPNLAGEYWGDPDTSSYRYEPECAFHKPATDVALIGHAYAPKAGVMEVTVSFRVGPVGKTVRVVGDRSWFKSLSAVTMSPPKPIERIPLVYERAFGGWDRSDPDPEKHDFEPRNPVGTGFRGKHGSFREGTRVPNLEDPRHPIRDISDRPPPAGFGFTSPSWQHRVAFAGTYDEPWSKQRMPLLPKDFDRRFFNAASPGLVAPGYLKGNEPVVVENASPEGKLGFHLPGVPPPACRVRLRGGNDHLLQTQLDTVIVDMDERLLFLIWRAVLALRSGPQDVVSIEIGADSASGR